MKRKFWSWVRDETEGRTLYLYGPIAQETWWGDEVTPQAFREELEAGHGDITVWINSPGGCVFAAAQIYTMLMEYPGQVTVKIDAYAASAASVIAMAGGEVHMSPVSWLIVHDPETLAIGNAREMDHSRAVLDEIKESIINAYELKTSLPRKQLSDLMEVETWMNAHKAVELGFADRVMYTDSGGPPGIGQPEALLFSRPSMTRSLVTTITNRKPHKGTPIASLEKRLSLLPH